MKIGKARLKSQLGNLDFISLNIYSSCDFLDPANGSDAPDCTDSLDGGKYL